MGYKKVAEHCKNCVSYKCEDCGYKKHLPTCECFDKLMVDASIAITELLARAENAEKKLAECEPKHAHWVETSFGEECSRCGYLPKFRKDDARLYCQSCGAIMDEAVE